MLCPATRRKCTAEPRSAKDKRGLEKSGEGVARKRTDPRRTGNGPMRRGVEQPSWDGLRMATAQTRYATSGDGKAEYRSAKAKQSRGMQRRWADTGCEGVALRSRAWRRQSEAWQGEGNALLGRGFEMQGIATEQHRSAARGNGLASPRDALRWRSKEPRRNAKALLCSASPCDGNAARNLDAQRSSTAANGEGVAQRIAAAETRSGSVPCGTGAWTRACRIGGGAGPAKDH